MNSATATANPFPSEAALNLEAISFVEEELDRVVLPPTSPLPHLLELRDVCSAYLRRVLSRKKGQGRCFLLQGENGSGKTHTLGDAFLRIVAGKLGPASGQAPTIGTDSSGGQTATLRRAPIVLYAKSREESISLITIHRELLGRLSVEQWRGLGRDAMALLASGKLAPEGDSIENVLEKLILDRGTLWRKQVAAMRPAGQRNDFTLAFSYLLGVELGRDTTLTAAARNWLAGNEVSTLDQRKLGVQGPIATQEDAAQAIQFLIVLCGLAERPLILAIDQLEKLVVGSDGSPALETLGLLHSLVEIAPSENSLLLLAGTRRAWDVFPADLRRRIANNVIICERLSLSLARNVIATYLNPKGRRARGGEASDEELEPFQLDAVRSMLASGGGSIRRLIQLASKAFEQIPSSGSIDAALIERIAQEAVYRNDRTFVRNAIQTELRSRALPYETDFQLPGSHADFVIFGSGRVPRVLLAISESIYIVDEVSRASELLELAREGSQMPVPPLLILVIAGYASPEVVRRLGEVPYNVIVYDAENFADTLGAFLDKLPPVEIIASAIVTSPRPDAALLERIDRIDLVLQSLAKEREPALQVLETGLEEEGRRQLAPRQSVRRQEAQRGWIEQRTHLEEQIRDAREKRAQAEMAELRRLRDAGEAAARQKANIFSLLFGGVCIVSLAILALFLMFDTKRSDSLSNDMKLAKEKINSLKFSKALTDDELSAREYDWRQWSRTLEGLSAELEPIQKRIRLYQMGLLASAGILMLVILGWLATRGYLFRSPAQRELSKPVETTAELEVLSLAFLDKTAAKRKLSLRKRFTSVFFGPRTVGDLLWDRNPQLRYAAAVAIIEWTGRQASDDSSNPEPWLNALRQERSAVVKWKLASAIGGAFGHKLIQVFATQDNSMESAYMIEGFLRGNASTAYRPLESLLLEEYPTLIRILCYLLTEDHRKPEDTIRQIMVLLFDASDIWPDLAKAYEEGIEKRDLSFLEKLSDTRLNEAITIVSPLQVGGAGTFDHLRVVNRVDSLFLFLRQVRYYKTWGDLLTSSPARP